MKQNMKITIMKTAQEMFGEKGYNSTSMRDIADVVGISVGNLTYHFKKKEDLIEAIIIHNHNNYQKNEAPHSISDLNSFFQKVIAQKSSNLYYFKHYTQLAQIFPRVYHTQLSAMHDLEDLLKQCFNSLLESGVFKQEYIMQYDGIVKVIMTLCVYGLPAIYCGNESDVNALTTDSLWSTLIPCLTEKGLAEYKVLLKR